MTKNIWAGLIALILVITCGVFGSRIAFASVRKIGGVLRRYNE